MIGRLTGRSGFPGSNAVIVRDRASRRFHTGHTLVRTGLAAALVAAVASVATAQSTFLGATANWSDASNWSTVPAWSSTTADLVFSSPGSLVVAANATNTNNVSSGTIRNLAFSGGPYTLSGNPLTMTGTMTNSVTGTNTIGFNMNLAFGANTTWTGTVGSTTILGGNLSGLSGRQLTLTNSGSLTGSVTTFVLAGNNSSLSGTINPAQTTGNNTVQVLLNSNNALGGVRLRLGNGNLIDNTSGSAVDAGGIIDMVATGANFGMTHPITTGTLNSANASLNMNVNGASVLTTSAISGLNMTKSGTGTLVIAGSSTYSNTFQPNGGSVGIGHVGAFGTGTISCQNNSGGTPSLFATQDLSSGTIANAFRISNDNRLMFTGSNSMKFSSDVTPLNAGGLNTFNFIFDNSNDSVITFLGRVISGGTTQNTSSVFTFSGAGNARIGGALMNASGSAAFSQSYVKAGTGILTLTASNSYSGTTALQGGLLRLENASALPGGVGASGGTNWLSMHSTAATAPVVLGLGSGNDNFERSLGTGVGQVAISGSGGGTGFAAFGVGVTRNVNLGGGSAAVTWGENNFMALRTGTFILGHATADGTVDFKNPLSTGTGGGTTRTISVAGNASVDARLSGVVSGTHALVIVGGGMLSLTGSNSFDKALQVANGGVEVDWLAATGANSPLGTSGSINLGGGSNSGAFRWVGATSGTTDRVFNLSGSTGANVTIDASGQGLLRIDGGVTAADGSKTLTLTGTNTGLNQIGVIQNPGSGLLTVVKDGPGRWRMTGTSTFGGGFSLNSGTIVAAANAGNQVASGVFGFNTPSVGGTAANLSGTVALLAEAGFEMRSVLVTGTGVGSTQAVLIGGANTTGTASYRDNEELRLGRNVALVAAGGGVVKFGSVWKDGSGNPNPSVDVAIGAPGYDGTVRFTNTSILATQGAVAVRNGTALIDQGATLDGAGPLSIDQGATLGGAGIVAATLGGAGLVAPGNSPGILTAEAFDASGGLDLAFEFTDSAPTYTSGTASVNDILRLTGASPFVSGSLSAANVVSLYLPASAVSGGSFTGGFFTDATFGSFANLLSTIQSASFVVYYASGTGAFPYNGQNYALLSDPSFHLQVGTMTVGGTTNFQSGGSAVDGQVSTFTVVVPEPAAILVAGIGVAIAGWAIRRRRPV